CMQTVDRLANLADRAALERERGHVEHRLVAVIERAEPVPAIERQAAFRGAEDADAPAARSCMLEKGTRNGIDLLGGSEWVTRDDRDAAHDPVGDQRALARPDEVRLVRSEDERRERVRPPLGHDLVSQATAPLVLVQAEAPGRQPGGDEQRGAAE